MSWTQMSMHPRKQMSWTHMSMHLLFDLHKNYQTNFQEPKIKTSALTFQSLKMLGLESAKNYSLQQEFNRTFAAFFRIVSCKPQHKLNKISHRAQNCVYLYDLICVSKPSESKNLPAEGGWQK